MWKKRINFREWTRNLSGTIVGRRVEAKQLQQVSWFSIVAMLLALAACSSSSLTANVEYANRKAEMDGSPFRWKAEPLPGGSKLVKVLADLPSGVSRADPTLRQDAFELISKVEVAAGRSEPQLQDVKLLLNSREVWLFEDGRERGDCVHRGVQTIRAGRHRRNA